jgi:hypothetical protein
MRDRIKARVLRPSSFKNLYTLHFLEGQNRYPNLVIVRTLNQALILKVHVLHQEGRTLAALVAHHTVLLKAVEQLMKRI